MRTKGRGFTLIELLVVMSVIAILMAILLPTIVGAVEHAKRRQCMSNVRQIVLAITLYAADNDDFTPPQPVGTGNGDWTTEHKPCTVDGTALEKQKFGISYFVADVLMDYAGDRGIFRCPSENRERYLEYGDCPNWTYAYCAENANISLGPRDAPDYGDPSRVWLVCDIQGPGWGSNHTARPWTRICYINVGYLDGHVRAAFKPAPTTGEQGFYSDDRHPKPPYGPRSR